MDPCNLKDISHTESHAQTQTEKDDSNQINNESHSNSDDINFRD